MTSIIDRLVESSREVFTDCCLRNGAIVAANPSHPVYPKDAKNYFYVWPRDACFTCIASDILGIEGVGDRFFKWLENNAEGWDETGLFYENYHVNGLKARTRFQPDQAGTVLLALGKHLELTGREDYGDYRDFVTRTADGLCAVWEKTHFGVVSNDVWEERLAFPDLDESFSYSVAACIAGLSEAGRMFPDKRYAAVVDEMKAALLGGASRGYFTRSFGTLGDGRIDASLLGIIWPFGVVEASDPLAVKTVCAIEEKLVRDQGVYRYRNDDYDGWVLGDAGRNKGAGFWPLLNFWMSIVHSKMGEREKAMAYYEKAIGSVESYLPEQVYSNEVQRSVCPLCWSHAMFVLCSKELGLL